MGKFTKYTRSQLAGMRPKTDKAQLAAAMIVIAEQRAQLKELKRLVRYQQIHIARLRAGEEIDFPEEEPGTIKTTFSNMSMASGDGVTVQPSGYPSSMICQHCGVVRPCFPHDQPRTAPAPSSTGEE